MAKGRWDEWEEQYLRTHWQTMTDKEIGEKLSREEDAITRKRKLLGLKKGANGRPSNKSREVAAQRPNELSLAQLPKVERLKFYKSQFNESWRFPHLKKVLLDDEVDYYRHRYIGVIDAMDSITYAEEDLVHCMIMCDVQIMRIQELIRSELKAYKDSDADDDTRRPPPQYLYKDLGDAEGRYVKLQEKLNLTRQQRLKENKEEDITIVSIVTNLLERRNRADADRLAGELDYFKNRAKKDMNKMDFLLGDDGL
ncbi:MAG: hypothetical protein ACXABY_02235 [Candidatus Thorarchaeota archaeon]